ncbi:hypothetical protein [Halomicrococcus sp. NG-SE-24]|uniref:hypothetical protein n=1 Tax=Halomicrococcus sp. NG-SE-24 TaxID=3436928 RepID=UPI003D95FA03
MEYAYYYLGLSIGATLLFGCTVLNIGPLAALSPATSTGVIIAAFTALTIVYTLLVSS